MRGLSAFEFWVSANVHRTHDKPLEMSGKAAGRFVILVSIYEQSVAFVDNKRRAVRDLESCNS